MKLRLVAENGELVDEADEFAEDLSSLPEPIPLRPGDGFEPVPGIPAF